MYGCPFCIQELFSVVISACIRVDNPLPYPQYGRQFPRHSDFSNTSPIQKSHICRVRFAPSTGLDAEGRKVLQMVMSSGAHKPKPLAAGGAVGPGLLEISTYSSMSQACAIHFQRTKWRSESLRCPHAQEMSSLYCTLMDRIARKRTTMSQTCPCMDACWCLALPACSSPAVAVSLVLLHGHLLFVTGHSEPHAQTASKCELVHLTTPQKYVSLRHLETNASRALHDIIMAVLEY